VFGFDDLVDDFEYCGVVIGGEGVDYCVE